MSVQVQWRRGSQAQNDAFVGAVGEITVDTENKQLRIHDGATAGGTPTVSLAGTETLENKTLVSATLTGTATGAGNITLTGNITGANLNTGAQVIATGNVTGGNINTVGQVIATGNIEAGNLVTVGDVTTATVTASSTVTATGNITGGNLITAGILSVNSGSAETAIENAAGNGVGNIGSASSYFNTVFAKATSAQYADVAERYRADADYAPGTVVAFGGNQEVTASQSSHTTTIAGIVSTAPALVMNNGLVGDNIVTVALLGRVPCRVLGSITKGSCLVASNIAGVATSLDPDQYQPGCIIGKALQDYHSDAVGEIEVAVGKL